MLHQLFECGAITLLCPFDQVLEFDPCLAVFRRRARFCFGFVDFTADSRHAQVLFFGAERIAVAQLRQPRAMRAECVIRCLFFQRRC